jgi:hypothetical protein
MAEENPSKRMTFEDSMFMLFAVMLVVNAIQRIPTILQDQLGIDIGSKYLVASAGLTATTPLQTRVNAPDGTSYYAQPSASEVPSGTFASGTSLFLSDGPKGAPFGGERFWYVEDTETHAIGWVPESALVREGVGGVSADTQHGTKARALMDASVWELPGKANPIDRMKKGERGTITDGPLAYAGSRWWFFNRDGSTQDGWVTEAVLTLTSDADWAVGSQVRATHDVDLFEQAGGGNTVGVLVEKGTAKVIGGPVNVGGAYWWQVETKDTTQAGVIQGWVAETSLEVAGVKGWFKGFLAVILTIGTVLTIGLLGGIVYATIRTSQIRAKEARRIRDAIPKKMQPKRNDRWDKVMTHVSSENPNDWRLAIIEADVMLDELITRMGYLGTTLGDRLKQVARGDMRTLDAAWEAHRVRNQVAHAGTDFILTQREARRVIELYGAVFAEFKFI